MCGEIFRFSPDKESGARDEITVKENVHRKMDVCSTGVECGMTHVNQPEFY